MDLNVRKLDLVTPGCVLTGQATVWMLALNAETMVKNSL